MLLTTSRPPRRARGFTLIELATVVTVAALLMTAAIPAIASWLGNARARTVAEMLQNDLRLAQVEALRRNRQTVFALTSSTPAWNTTPAQNGTDWYVRAQPMLNSTETASSASFVTGTNYGNQAGVTISGPALSCFNSMGQLTSVDSASTGLGVGCNTADATDPTKPVSYVVSKTGADRSYKVMVYLGGRVRMCDMSKTLSSTNPDGCPA
ncbi:MAG: GspH/FimT family pseudopilin [Proteobacteria bacterium]|nr:GspH/FimT family pseudopilin [Pseudomonadota bacterium]